MNLDPSLSRNLTALNNLTRHLERCETRPCAPFPRPAVVVLDPADNPDLYRVAERLADLCGPELGPIMFPFKPKGG